MSLLLPKISIATTLVAKLRADQCEFRGAPHHGSLRRQGPIAGPTEACLDGFKAPTKDKDDPMRVVTFNQVDLPIPLPFLELPFSDQRRFERLVSLIPDQWVD